MRWSQLEAEMPPFYGFIVMILAASLAGSFGRLFKWKPIAFLVGGVAGYYTAIWGSRFFDSTFFAQSFWPYLFAYLGSQFAVDREQATETAGSATPVVAQVVGKSDA